MAPAGALGQTPSQLEGRTHVQRKQEHKHTSPSGSSVGSTSNAGRNFEPRCWTGQVMANGKSELKMMGDGLSGGGELGGQERSLQAQNCSRKWRFFEGFSGVSLLDPNYLCKLKHCKRLTCIQWEGIQWNCTFLENRNVWYLEEKAQRPFYCPLWKCRNKALKATMRIRNLEIPCKPLTSHGKQTFLLYNTISSPSC